VSRVGADARRPIEYRRTGTLQVARTALEAQQLERQSRALADAGVTATLIDDREVRRLEPALTGDVRAGLLVPQHGYVRVAALMEALVAAAARRGAVLSAGGVRRIARVHDRIAVDTGDETLTAEAVVVAAAVFTIRSRRFASLAHDSIRRAAHQTRASYNPR